MKYTPKLPDDSVNVSKENPLSTLTKLLISLSLLAVISYFLMGSIINFAVDSITEEQEIRLDKLLSVDLDIPSKENKYLAGITKKLEKCAGLPYPVSIQVMDDDKPNAFAAPGGEIYVTKGILKKASNENELAFIIGHELGHFKNRDHLRGAGYKVVLSIIGLLIGSDYGLVGSTTLNIGSARYSQSSELKADIFGLETVQCAYGNVASATTMFEKMDDGEEWKHFTATHPGFKKRVTKMNEKIEKDHLNRDGKIIPLGDMGL